MSSFYSPRNYWFRCILRRTASSYGHFSSAKEFRSQCHIFRFESRLVRKSPSGQKSMKAAPASPSRSLFENCSKSWFDTVRWWGMSYFFFDSPRNYWFRCFLRRVMVIFRQQRNFGPNVIYFVLGTLLIDARLIHSNIAYCCEFNILIDQNIAYCCEIDIFIDQNIA